MARGCPPKEDIAASLAHAENQFLAGDYPAARKTLADARGRNGRYRETLPVEVSDLERALGRLSSLNGFTDLGRLMQMEALDSLKAGLAPSDYRIFVQRIAVADDFALQGRWEKAEATYAKVARQARKAGFPGLRGYAVFRRAMLLTAVATMMPRLAPRGRALLEELARSTEPELAQIRTAAKMVQASEAARTGDEEAFQTAIGALQPFDRPMLVYSPPVKPLSREPLPGGKNIAANVLAGPPMPPQWLDFRLSIAPDGRVEDVTTLRASDSFDERWEEAIRASLKGRRYTPYRVAEGEAPEVRIERFSLVYDVKYLTGSKRAQRSVTPRVSSIDLTPEKPAVGPS